MNGRLAIRALLAVLATGWLGLRDGRAGTLQSIVADDKGVFTSGNLTFTFTDKSLSVDPANPPLGTIFTPPAPAGVDVTAVAGGVMFSFNPFLSLTTPDAITQNITISYTVTAKSGFVGAGLSFSGLAVDLNTSSVVTETFAGLSLEVFSKKDADLKETKQNDQSAKVPGLPTSLDVVNSAVLSTGVRGNGEKSTAQLSSIANTFALVPEPSTALGVVGVLFALGTRRLRKSGGLC